MIKQTHAQDPRLLIHLEDVGKTYRTGDVIYRALDSVNLKVYEGDYLAIVGPSGSGKSTCMNIIGLLDSLDEGVYYLLGEDISTLTEEEKAVYRNKLIGFVFQSFNLIPELNLLDNVALPLFYAGVSENERREKAFLYLSQVGLKDYVFHKPTELSGGQKQRGAIARALVNEPTLILADEPTGNLDSKTAKEVLNILDNLVAEGRTVILITHDDSAAARAHKKVRIFDGKITEIETDKHKSVKDPK